MFDVRDPQNPTEIDVKEIGGNGSTTIVNTDHKGFLWDQRNQLLSLPITVNDNAYKMAFQGSYVYKVDLESGFKLQARISHLNYDLLNKKIISTPSNNQPTLNEYGELTENEFQKESSTLAKYTQNKEKYYISRQLYIDNYLITISAKMLQSHSLDNFKKVSEIE